MTYKERLLERVEKWILTDIEEKDQAKYFRLLAYEEDVVLKLYQQSEELKYYKKCYNDLQKEQMYLYKESMPNISIKADSYRDYYTTRDNLQIVWKINPFFMSQSFIKDEIKKYNFDKYVEMEKIFLRGFDEQYVPKLREETQNHYRRLVSMVT